MLWRISFIKEANNDSVGADHSASGRQRIHQNEFYGGVPLELTCR